MKGIKTLLGALAVASLLVVSFGANAQENNNRDENGAVVRGPYETNGFFDNWFIGIGGGYNAGIRKLPKDGNDFLKFDLEGKGGLAIDVNVGKWFTPTVGARIGWKGVANNQGKFMWFPKGNIFTAKGGQQYIHADFLWNLSNSIGGYKETRFWNLVPYTTFGGIWYEGNRAFAAGVGLLNDFRITDRVGLFLDLQLLATRGATYGSNYKVAGLNLFFPATATAGLKFNLGRTNFDRHSSITPVVIPVPFTVDQYNALKDKVAALEKENANLKNQIKGLQDQLGKFAGLKNGQEYLYKDGKFIPTETKTISTPAALYFDLGKSTLSAREIAHLEYFANNALADANEIIVTGSADSKTGTPKLNQTLSEKRAEYVKNLLVKNFGVAADKIKTNALGGVATYNTPAKNRVVTVEAK